MLTRAEKRKWVKALRSGQYVKGRGALCVLGKGEEYYHFCCLGVLAEELGMLKQAPKTVPCSYIRRNKDREYWGVGGGGARTSRNHFYLGEVRYKGRRLLDMTIQRQLACMNDMKNLSFNQIADWIVKNVKTQD